MDPRHPVHQYTNDLKGKRVASALARFVMTGLLTALITSCATYKTETFSNVKPSELMPETVSPGTILRLEYEDGTHARLIVREVTENAFVSTDGSEWPKNGISKMTVKFEDPYAKERRKEVTKEVAMGLGMILSCLVFFPFSSEIDYCTSSSF